MDESVGNGDRSAQPAHWTVRRVGKLGAAQRFGRIKGGQRRRDSLCVRFGQLYTKYRGFIFTIEKLYPVQSCLINTQPSTRRCSARPRRARRSMKLESQRREPNADRCCAWGDVIILRPRIDILSAAFLGYAPFFSCPDISSMCRVTDHRYHPSRSSAMAAVSPTANANARTGANRKIDGFVRASS